MMIAHITLNFSTWNQCCNGVNDDDVNRIGSHKHLADLKRLLPKGFLASTDIERLADLVRYLKAVHVRADRQRADRSKDRVKARQIQPFDDELEKISSDLAIQGAARRQQIDIYRWLLEEYRVSVFAQELGTAQRVSAKRLHKQLEAVERADS